MKKLLSAKYSPGAVNASMLILRLGMGLLMIHHGYDKLVHFGEYQDKFMNFMGLGRTISLAMVVFAEFFCSLFIIIGLFTRLATVPLIITLCVVLFKVNDGKVFDHEENIPLYLLCLITLLIIGPGRVSVDSMTGK